MEKFLIGVAVIFISLSVMRILGVYEIYVVDTPAMIPNYHPNKYMIGINITSPKYSDVVSYRSDSLIQILRKQYRSESYIQDGAFFFSRVVGKGGDRIELRNGVIYLNGKKNEPNNFMLKYSIEKNAFYQLNERVLPKRELYSYEIQDSVFINLSQKEVANLSQFVEVNKSTRSYSGYIFGDENWTYGYYGPIEIPAQHFFLVSDNRYAAMDSRVHGFVHMDDIVSVILN